MLQDLVDHYYCHSMHVDDRHNFLELRLKEKKRGIQRSIMKNEYKRVRFFFIGFTPGERACSNCERFLGICCCTAVDPTNSSISSIGLKNRKENQRYHSSKFHPTLFTLNGFPKTCCRTGCASISLNGGACPLIRGYSS